MRLVIRNTGRSVAAFASKAKGVATRAGAAVTGALVAAPAFAGGGDDLASEVLTELGGLKADVSSILLVIIGCVALFVLYKMIRKATG